MVRKHTTMDTPTTRLRLVLPLPFLAPTAPPGPFLDFLSAEFPLLNDPESLPSAVRGSPGLCFRPTFCSMTLNWVPTLLVDLCFPFSSSSAPGDDTPFPCECARRCEFTLRPEPPTGLGRGTSTPPTGRRLCGVIGAVGSALISSTSRSSIIITSFIALTLAPALE